MTRILVVAISLWLQAAAFAQEPPTGSWTPLPPGPQPFSSGASATDGTYFWHFGGAGSLGTVSTSRAIRRYDPAMGTWLETLANLPYQVQYNAGAYYGGFLWSFGSINYPPLPPGAGTSTPANPILKYDIANDTWTTLPVTLASNGYRTTATTLGTKIYVAGGYVPGSGYSNALTEFDPAAETLTPRAPIPVAGIDSHAACASSVTNRLYVFGGRYYNSATATSTIYAGTWEYDPATDVWTAKADLPLGGRFWHSAFELNGRIYVAGGQLAAPAGSPTPTVATPTVLEYDPVADTWTQRASLPGERRFHGAAAIGGAGYVYGGGSPTDTTMPQSLVRFDPPALPPVVPPGGTPPPPTGGGSGGDNGGSDGRTHRACGGTAGAGASAAFLYAALLAALAAGRRWA